MEGYSLFKEFHVHCQITPQVELCKLTVLPADFEITYFILEPKQ